MLFSGRRRIPLLVSKNPVLLWVSLQPIFNQFQEMGVQFHEGLPDNMAAICPPETRPGLIIMDDLMHVSSKSSQVTNLLTKGTHHLDLFAISLLQNLFHSGREQAGQNRNYHYTVLFKNPADTRYIKRPTLGP